MSTDVTTAPSAREPQAPDLIDEKDLSALRSEWDAVQSMFVDDPQAAVARADELAIRVLAALSDALTRERAGLRQRWSRWNGTNTEELRLCLQQYRALFQRLLAAEPIRQEAQASPHA